MQILPTALALLAGSAAGAADIYVSEAGDDGWDGSAPAHGAGSSGPRRSLQAGFALAAAGDTLWVLDGTYANSGTDFALWIDRSGREDAWITIRAMPGHHPVVAFTGWGGIGTNDASYIRLIGLEVRGAAGSQSLADARADALAASPSAAFNGTGIMIDGSPAADAAPPPHHWLVEACRIHHCPSAGIGTIQADHVTVERSDVWSNAWHSRYGTSGISFWQCRASDAASGAHMVVSRNRVWDNRSLVPLPATGQLTDGNGVIIDDSRNTQAGSTRGAYTGSFLVADNLLVANGGSGAHAYLSDRVDFIGNTSWRNSRVVDFGEIAAESSGDVRILGNVLVGREGRKTTTSTGSTGTVRARNVILASGTADTGADDLLADPLLAAPGDDPSAADFGLRSGSPAVDRALAAWSSPLDLAGRSRSGDGPPDAGCLERDLQPPAQPPAPLITAGGRRPRLSGTAEPGCTVLILDGGRRIGQATAAGDGTWSWTAGADLAAGRHALEIVAVDAAGNQSPSTAAGEVTISARDDGPGCGGALGVLLAGVAGLSALRCAAGPGARPAATRPSRGGTPG